MHHTINPNSKQARPGGLLNLVLAGLHETRGRAPDERRMLLDDREWFASNPTREYRVRGCMVGDIPYGTIDPRRRVVGRMLMAEGNGRGIRFRMDFIPLIGDDTTTDEGCACIWRRLVAATPGLAPGEAEIAALRKAADEYHPRQSC